MRRSRATLVAALLVTVGVLILGLTLAGRQAKPRDFSMTTVGAESWPPPEPAPRDEARRPAQPPTTSTTTAPTTTTPAVTAPPKLRRPATSTTRAPAKAGDVARGVAVSPFLACVARWESGGGGSPRYHDGAAGAYGILVSTWTNRTLGYSTRYGTSTAGAASEAAQDAAALDLFHRYGTKPWTTRGKCGA